MCSQCVIGSEKMQPELEKLNKKIICGLCLNIISYTNSKVIEKVTIKLLETCLPNLSLKEGLKHFICKPCCSKLCAAFNFKLTCMDTEDIISSYLNSNMSVVDLKEVYLKANGNNQLEDISENQIICRLCLQLVTFGYVSLYEVDNGIIDTYIPQVNISATKDPVICELCLDSLCIHGTFVKNCLDAQEKYKSADTQPYIKTEEIVVKLEDGHNGQERNTDNQSYFTTETIQIKLEGDQDAQGEYKNIDEQFNIKTEEIEIKQESDQHALNECENIDKLDYINSQGMEIKSEEEYQENEPSSPNLNGKIIKNRKKQIYEEMGETRYDKYDTKIQINKRDTPLDVPSYKNRLKKRIKSNLKKKLYGCDACDYKTEYKWSLKSHQLVHKDPSEIQMYKCDTCTYETKYKNGVKKHQLIHKDPSEIQMYKCDTCTYETKYKTSLKDHQIIHKDPSEIQMYKCLACNFETKRMRTLRIHQLTHKKHYQIRIYKCDTCTYQTRRKTRMTDHQLTHKDPSEMQRYMCDICGYATIYKGRLKSHQLKHGDFSKIQLYKCDICTFQSKYKKSMDVHMLLHKDPSEIQMYKCDTCTYETKYKGRLKNHQLIHKYSEIQV